MAVVKKIRHKQGYSLLEMVVALGIMSSLILSMMSIVSNGLGFHGKGLKMVEAQQSARNGIDMIVRDLKESIKVINVSGDTLTLINPEGKNVKYYVQSCILYRRTNGTRNPVANNIYGISANEVMPRQYDISVTAQTGTQDIQLSRRVTK
ncbi:MAG: type II secretion system protein J [Candidatus Saccharibacteria bacterium]